MVRTHSSLEPFGEDTTDSETLDTPLARDEVSGSWAPSHVSVPAVNEVVDEVEAHRPHRRKHGVGAELGQREAVRHHVGGGKAVVTRSAARR